MPSKEWDSRPIIEVPKEELAIVLHEKPPAKSIYPDLGFCKEHAEVFLNRCTRCHPSPPNFKINPART